MRPENPYVFPKALNAESGRGMRLWDLFAAEAMKAIVSTGPHDCTPDEIASDAAWHADAMLRERQKRMGGDDGP